MRKHGMPEAHATHPNVTPLIDIVMCLIIFFMLVAKIGVSTGADNKIVIPATIRGAEIKDMGNTLTLNVQPGPLDQPIVTALVKGEVRELKLVDPTNGVRQLFVELAHLRNGPDGKLNTNDDNVDFKIIIRGAEDMPYAILEPVLKTCAEAQVKNVNFNTRRVSEVVSG
ncbi:MAG: biopolymer transporter ExbD [Tepidisphaeraceae bacterium]